MSKFLDHLDYEDISEGSDILRIRLTQPFRVWSDVLGALVTVPTGFECDGESIPSILHSIVPPFGASRRGAIVHDYLYTFGGYVNAAGSFVPVTRQTADLVYRDLLILAGLSTWRAFNRWFQLRLYGFVAWNEHRRKDSPSAVADRQAVS